MNSGRSSHAGIEKGYRCPACLHVLSAEEVYWTCPRDCLEPRNIRLADTLGEVVPRAIVSSGEVSFPCSIPGCGKFRAALHSDPQRRCGETLPTPWDSQTAHRREIVIAGETSRNCNAAVRAFVSMVKAGFGPKVQGLNRESTRALADSVIRDVPIEKPLRFLANRGHAKRETLIGLRDVRPRPEPAGDAAASQHCLSLAQLPLATFLQRNTDIVIPVSVKRHTESPGGLTSQMEALGERIGRGGADHFGHANARLWFVAIGIRAAFDGFGRNFFEEQAFGQASREQRDHLFEGYFATGLQMEKSVAPLMALWAGKPPVWLAAPDSDEVLPDGHAMWSLLDSLEIGENGNGARVG